MKKIKEINLSLIFSLVVLAAISFGPCIRDLSTLVLTPRSSVKTLPYTPFFFCIVSAIEIILIIVSNHRVFRLIGMILHLFKMLIPYALYQMGVLQMIDGASHTYTLSWGGYVLFSVGIAALIFYGFDIIKNGHRFS